MKANLCDYNDAYILVKGDSPATQVSFNKYAPFTKSIIKSNVVTTNNAEDLDLVMPM